MIDSWRQRLLLLLLYVTFLGPLLFLIFQSMVLTWEWGTLWPQEFGWAGWSAALRDPALQEALLVTVATTVLTVLLNLVIGLPAAKILAAVSFKGKAWIDTLLFLPILLPVTALSMGLHVSMIRAGLADTWQGVVLVLLIPTVPYTIRVLRSGFERIGKRTNDEGRTLGGHPLQNFWYLEWPQMLSSVRAAIFLTVVISISQYVLVVIIGGGTVTMLAMIYFPYTNTANDAVLSAFSLLFAMLPAGVVLVGEIAVRLSMPKRGG